MTDISSTQSLIATWLDELESTEADVKEFCVRQIRKAESMLNSNPLQAESIVSSIGIFIEDAIGDYTSRIEIHKEALLVRGGTLYRLARYEEAYAVSVRALDIAKELGDSKGEALALNTMGAVAIAQGEYENALHHHTGSLTLRKALGDDALTAISLMNIGNVYLALGDVTNAHEYFMQSLLLREQINDEHGIGVSLSNIGIVYGMMGDTEQAIEYLQKSLTKKISTNNKQGQIQTLCDLASQYIALDDVERAREHANVARQVAVNLGNRDGESSALHLLGLIEAKAAEFILSLDYFYQALQIRTEVNNTKGVIETILAQTDVFIQLNRFNDALAILHDIRQRTESLHSLTLLRSLHLQYSLAYEGMNECKLALYHSRLYHEMHEKVFNQHSAERLRNLQILHQVEYTKKENEIYRLRNFELAQAYGDADKLSRSLSISNAELNEAVDMLEKINKEKNDIFGIVVHDLRNPLTAIVLTASNALQNSQKLSNEDIVLSLQRIKKNADRMSRIIKKMMDMFSADSGSMKISLEQHDIVPIIDKIADTFLPVAAEKNIMVEVMSVSHAIAEIDAVVFEEIIDNLLSNAIKFSPRGTTVNVKVSTIEKHINLENHTI